MTIKIKKRELDTLAVGARFPTGTCHLLASNSSCCGYSHQTNNRNLQTKATLQLGINSKISVLYNTTNRN